LTVSNRNLVSVETTFVEDTFIENNELPLFNGSSRLSPPQELKKNFGEGSPLSEVSAGAKM